MNKQCVFDFLLLLCVDQVAGGISFISPYQGRRVRGSVGSSMQFNWSFTGDVGLIQWGLSAGDDAVTLDTNQILFKLLKTGEPGSFTTPAAYVGRVTGSRTNELVIFTLHNLETDDARFYVCTLAPLSPGITISDHVELVVEDPPNITGISANQTVDEGNDLTLNCNTSGSPGPNTTWTRLQDYGVVTMPLTNITRQDEGGYRCTANNGIGNPVSKDVFITVHYQPSITSVISSRKQSWIGQRVELKCVADGSPTPSITWRGPRGNKLKIVTSTENTVHAQMESDHDFGNYTCEANNLVGAVTGWVQLIQIKPPGSPNLTTNDNDIHASSLILRWTAPADDGGSPIIGYNLIILHGVIVILNKTISASHSEYRVGRLTKSTNYTLRVSAMNKVFQGNASEKKVTTKYEGAPASVDIIGLPSETKDITVTLKWNEPQNNGAPITQYTVYRRIVNADDTVRQWNMIRVIKNISNREVIVELEKNKVYEFVVTATNGHGNSLKEGKSIRRLEVLGDVPEPVVIVKAEIEDGQITLTWTKPEENGAAITRYSVYKRIANDLTWTKVADVQVTSSEKYVFKLERGKIYDLMMTATNEYGSSNNSNIKTVKVPNGVAADQNQQPVPKGVNLAIIVGAATVGVLLILGVTVFVIWRKRRKTPSETGSATAGLQGPYPEEMEEGYSAVAAPSAAHQLQAGGPVPDVTYAQVDKSKKKKKKKNDVYAQVDKSKKSNKKRNKQPGELEYAELDDFRPNTQPAPQASGANARPLFRAPLYEGTEYADITQFGVPKSEPTYDNVPRKKDVVYSNVESM